MCVKIYTHWVLYVCIEIHIEKLRDKIRNALII